MVHKACIMVVLFKTYWLFLFCSFIYLSNFWSFHWLISWCDNFVIPFKIFMLDKSWYDCGFTYLWEYYIVFLKPRFVSFDLKFRPYDLTNLYFNVIVFILSVLFFISLLLLQKVQPRIQYCGYSNIILVGFTKFSLPEKGY